MLYVTLDSEFEGLSYELIELIYMLYIPLDSEFEGVSYEGILFFLGFLGKYMITYDFGQSLSFKFFL